MSLYRPKPQARLRLFCFPYAGGGASIFRDWADSLPATVEVRPIQLPGRESRFRERPFSQITELLPALSLALQPYLDKPFAFWGHSMGALISFELARRLRRENKPGPLHLFLSGHKAPQLPDSLPSIHQLPDKEFLQEVRKLNGAPEAVWRNIELMQLMLPVLRADFTLVETYTYTDEQPLDCSISAFGGLHDDRVSHDDLKAWQAQTQHAFTLRMFPGDHFYIHSHSSQLLSVLSQDLRQLLSRIPG
jgi:medium-chain acyl-[acyl-carrier-protein] hydrolase